MLSRLRDRAREEQGVTLVELLVTMVVLGLIAGALITALNQGVQAGYRGQSRGDALIDLQTVAQRLSREIRAANPILVADAGVVEVQTVRAGQTRRYRYELVAMPAPSTRFLLRESRIVNGATATFDLAEEVPTGGLALQYLDGTGTVLGNVPLSQGDRARVKSVRVTLSRFIPAVGQPMTVSTTVSVRNNA